MPIAQIDSRGTSIYYEDSGVPDGSSTYTTLVFGHGALINSGLSVIESQDQLLTQVFAATFERMLPVAPKHGLRIITMNGRDYRGSTPYTDEELADMTSPDIDVQATAVRRWGHEVALFVVYVCQRLGIPATTRDNPATGGLVFVAWSLSGVAILSMLGDPQTMGNEVTRALAPYLRKIVLYGQCEP